MNLSINFVLDSVIVICVVEIEFEPNKLAYYNFVDILCFLICLSPKGSSVDDILPSENLDAMQNPAGGQLVIERVDANTLAKLPLLDRSSSNTTHV